MALPKRRRRDQEGAIPVEAFSDIAFLLIIFFVLVTTLQQTIGQRVELPASDQSQEQTDDQTPTVLLKGSEVYFDDELITTDALRTSLEALNLRERIDAERIVLMEATGETPYQVYFEVMTSIAAAGGQVGILREAEE